MTYFVPDRFTDFRRRFRAPVYARFASAAVGYLHPRNDLPSPVRSYVLNIVCDIHAPMDAAGLTGLRIASSDLNEQIKTQAGVGFIVQKICIRFAQLAEEVRRPMALLACLLCRAQVFDWCGNRPGVFVKQD
jgi:hypothetical protein